MERNRGCKAVKGLGPSLVTAVLVLAIIHSPAVQATTSCDGHLSLMNPLNPANLVLEMALNRSLGPWLRVKPHAGVMEQFSNPSLFAEYGFGTNQDKRAGGFDNDFDSWTFGGEAMVAGSTFMGVILNFTDADGTNGGGTADQIETWTPNVYVSRSINDWLYWGGSLSYSMGESTVGTTDTDSDSLVVAPSLMAIKQIEQWTLSLSPSYVLGSQEVDYTTTSDTALMGRMLLMGRAAYAVNDKLSAAANLNYNAVLHNHGLDTENDNDHQWFTSGVQVNYQCTEQIGAYAGYTCDFDSNFDDNYGSVGGCFAF